MDVIVVEEGAGVVLRNPKGAIQQRFSIFLPRGYAHERNGCSVPGPAPSVREEGFCIAIAYDLLFSILKAISVFVRSGRDIVVDGLMSRPCMVAQADSMVPHVFLIQE